jgi:N utilization substance protein B
MPDETPPDITKTGLQTRLARRLAMQLVFVADANGRPSETADEQVTADATRDVDPNDRRAMSDAHAARRRAVAAARGVWSQAKEIYATLLRLAPQWPPHRMPAVERAVLNLATWELLNTPTPPAVVIDEAIELAREYGGPDSPRFVNGVLDAALKEREALLTGV